MAKVIADRGYQTAVVVAETKDMPREQWLDLRKGGIGGSEAAAVANVSKYGSPLTVYMDKRNLYTRDVPNAVKEAAEWGNIMEPVLRKQFTLRINAEREALGLKALWVQQRHALFAHPEHDFMRTNLDGQIFGHEAGKGILEIKTGSEYTKDEWDGEDVPNAYYLQVQHNLKVMEFDFAYLVVLIGGNKYKHYYIERDEETINSLVAIEYNFWHNHVLQGVPPVVDGSDATKEMYGLMYPNSEPSDRPIINLPDALIYNVEALDVVKELIDTLTEEKTKHENEIKATMGTNEVAWCGPHKITWKTRTDGARAMRIMVNPDNNKKDEIRDKHQRAIDRKRNELEKEKAALEKERLKAEKAAAKAKQDARKVAEKEAKAAVKAAKKKAKELEKQKEIDADTEIFLNVLHANVENIEKLLNGGNE